MTPFSLPPETHQIQRPPSHVTVRLLSVTFNYHSGQFRFCFCDDLSVQKLSVDVNLTLMYVLSIFKQQCYEMELSSHLRARTPTRNL